MHALLGGHGQKLAPIYDGSIYMEDIDPETRADLGLGPLRDAVHAGLAYGYEAFKMKIGRGARWMERRQGLRRDIEAIRAVREIIGPRRRLLVGGNNAYTPAEAAELVCAVRPLGIFWFEEPFAEDIEASGTFRRFLHAEAPEILLADGEDTVPSQPEIRAVLRTAAIDVIQFDLRGCPVTPWRTILPLVEEAGLLVAPHNWASHLLNYYIPHIGRGIRGFCIAETDTSNEDHHGGHGCCGVHAQPVQSPDGQNGAPVLDRRGKERRDRAGQLSEGPDRGRAPGCAGHPRKGVSRGG